VYLVADAMGQDAALLRAFVEAECRLLQDTALKPEAVKRVRRSLEHVLVELSQRELRTSW
jgi:hypothetical protein